MQTVKKQDTNTPEWQDGLEKEKIVARITDLILPHYGMKYNRTDTKKEQDMGIDFIIKDKVFDEKAAVSCVLFDLKTYTIEIYHAAHVNHEGWFTSTIAKTTHYLLVYVRATDDTLKEIWRWEGMFINAAILHEYYSYIEDFVAKILPLIDLNKIQKGEDCTLVLYDGGKDDTAKLIFSHKFDEIVINLQLSKSLLLKMCNRDIIWCNKDGEEEYIDTRNYSHIPEETLERLREFKANNDDKVAEVVELFNNLPAVS